MGKKVIKDFKKLPDLLKNSADEKLRKMFDGVDGYGCISQFAQGATSSVQDFLDRKAGQDIQKQLSDDSDAVTKIIKRTRGKPRYKETHEKPKTKTMTRADKRRAIVMRHIGNIVITDEEEGTDPSKWLKIDFMIAAFQQAEEVAAMMPTRKREQLTKNVRFEGLDSAMVGIDPSAIKDWLTKYFPDHVHKFKGSISAVLNQLHDEIEANPLRGGKRIALIRREKPSERTLHFYISPIFQTMKLEHIAIIRSAKPGIGVDTTSFNENVRPFRAMVKDNNGQPVKTFKEEPPEETAIENDKAVETDDDAELDTAAVPDVPEAEDELDSTSLDSLSQAADVCGGLGIIEKLRLMGATSVKIEVEF